jgi:phenylacetate-CoA ligase
VSDANAVGAENRRRIVLQLRDQFLALARGSKEELENYQFNELKNIVKFSKQRIPYYTNSLESINDVENFDSLTELLAALPTLSRRQAQENFDGLYFKAPDQDPNDYVIQATSGSTGKPVSVMKFAPLYSAEYDALTLTEWQLNNRDTSKTISTFRIVETEYDQIPLGAPLSYIGATRLHTSLSILKRTIAELLDELHRLRPAYLFVNGIVARQLALAQLESGYEPIKIEQFLTVSDRVDPQLRILVNEVFGARIIDRYSSEEFGYIALQCPVHDHLHACSPSLIVEVVDENGQACDVGAPGRVLVTSLHNFAMPLIRYDIGDIAELGEPCNTGLNWPVLNQVNGRVRDSVILPNGEFRLVTFFDSKMLGTRKLRDYQIILFQDAIAFLYYVEIELDDEELSDIQNEILEAFKLDLPVIFRRMESSNWQNLWKRREWYRVDAQFNSTWTESEFLSVLSDLSVV